MINLIEGKINLGKKNILAVYNEELNTLAEVELIEKREDAVGIYYYTEADVGSMRFGVFISLREKRIDWLRLIWLDSSMKGWGEVSEKAMKDEYRLLSNCIQKMVGRPPDHKKIGNVRGASIGGKLKWLMSHVPIKRISL